MNILIECRSITPRESCGIENFVYSLVRGWLETFPEDQIFLNIRPGTGAAMQAELPDPRVRFLEDAKVAPYHALRRRFPPVHYLVGVLRRLHPALTAWLEGPRSAWVRHCEDQVDVVLYPYARLRLVHLCRPTVMVPHALYDFEFAGPVSLLARLEMWYSRRIETESIRHADVVVVSWPGPLKSLCTLFPWAKDKSFMIPFSVEPVPPQTALASDNGASRLLIYAANASPHKNHDNLIRSLGVVSRSGAEPLRVVCPGTVAPSRGKALRRLVTQEGVESWIEFPGYLPRSELLELYRRAAGVVAPTRYEAFSGTVYEGLQYGKPVACSCIPPLTELIDYLGVRVRFFDPLSPEDIAAAMLEILDNPRPYRESAREAREALSRITPQRTARQYREVMAWICGQGSKPAWHPAERI